LRAARTADSDSVRGLVAAAHLPAAEIERFIEGFVVAEQEGAIVGCGGLELYGAAAVVRSVVVEPGLRGTGLGRRIATVLEQNAAKAGAVAAYLFTVEAWRFWQHLGYEALALDGWPAAARACWQYRYVSSHQQQFRAMGLRSMWKSLQPTGPGIPADGG
jgi:N-acetylglutamate synthase-like GNAT family acetyltransferase